MWSTRMCILLVKSVIWYICWTITLLKKLKLWTQVDMFQTPREVGKFETHAGRMKQLILNKLLTILMFLWNLPDSILVIVHIVQFHIISHINRSKYFCPVCYCQDAHFEMLTFLLLYQLDNYIYIHTLDCDVTSRHQTFPKCPVQTRLPPVVM